MQHSSLPTAQAVRGGRVDASSRVHSQRGLTLVELLVVLVIMAVVSGLAIASIPDPESEVEKTARAFASSADQLADAAIISGQPMGLHVTANGWRALRYTEGQWTSLGVREASGIAQEDVRLELDLSDAFVLPEPEEGGDFVLAGRNGGSSADREEAPAITPGIIFDPVGEATVYTLTAQGQKRVWAVAGGPLGETEVTRREP